MRYLTFLLAALWLLALPTPAAADQSDPRLDALFDALQHADSMTEVAAAEQQIWAIWYTYDDPQVTKLMNRGVVALAEERYRDALRLFTRVTELAPDFAEGWNRRATTYFLMGRYHDALADIERVLMLAPRHFAALAGRGLCYRALGKPRAELVSYLAALLINPYGMERVQIEAVRLRHRLDYYPENFPP